MNWLGFGIAFVLLAIVPVWVIPTFADISFLAKIASSAILGIIVFVAVQYGGTSRGFVSR